MQLASPTIQVARCECCPGLPVGAVARQASDSRYQGGFVSFETVYGAYADGGPGSSGSPLGTAYYLTYTPGGGGTPVTYTPSTGLFAPDPPPAHYLHPTEGGPVATLGGSYSAASFKAVVVAAVASALATHASPPYPAEEPQISTSLLSAYLLTTGARNVVQPPEDEPFSNALSYDALTNDPSEYNQVAYRVCKDIVLRVGLAYPHIAGSYGITYRIKRRQKRKVVHVEYGGTVGAPTSPVNTVALDDDAVTYDDPATITATPAEGGTSVEFPAFDLPEPNMGETISVVGPAGKCPFSTSMTYIGGEARKRGFMQYTGGPDGAGGPRRVFSRESASGPGFSGFQTIDPNPENEEPRDSEFSASVPPDLAALGFPAGDGLYYDQPSKARLLSQSETVSTYQVPGAPEGEQVLSLTLSDEYTTAALKARVDPAVDAGFPEEAGGGYPSGLFAEHYLSPGEVYYRRASGRLSLSATLPTLDPLVFGDDDALEYTVLWDKVTTNLDTGEVTRTSESWDVSLTREEQRMTDQRDFPAPASNRIIRLENFRTDPETDERIEGGLAAIATL